MALQLDDGYGGMMKRTLYENTYRLEPEEAVKFKAHKVSNLLKSLLKERLEGQAYDPVRGSQLTKQLADDIRERVKALGFERHKLVVHVTIGERRWQTFSSCSRCLWDTATDGYTSECFQNETLFCSAQVYALYFE